MKRVMDESSKKYLNCEDNWLENVGDFVNAITNCTIRVTENEDVSLF